MVCVHTFTQVIAHGSDAVHGHIEACHTLHYMLIGLCLGSRKQIYPPHLHTLEDTSIHFYSTLSLPPSLSLSLPLSLSPSLSPSLPPPPLSLSLPQYTAENLQMVLEVAESPALLEAVVKSITTLSQTSPQFFAQHFKVLKSRWLGYH